MQLGLRLWRHNRCVPGDTLICPVMVLWKDYLYFCVMTDVVSRANADMFVRFLGGMSSVRLIQRGRGKRRQVAEGIGLKPIEGVYDSAHHVGS